MTPQQLHHLVLDQLQLDGSRPLIVAVSGGADSTALLHIVAALHQSFGVTWTPHIAHLHHGWRGTAANEDAAFVRDCAASYNLPFHTERRDIPAIAESNDWSLEEAARRKRLDFLKQLAQTHAAAAVVTAHHAEDQAETILHNLIRGTGLRGASGMSQTRPISADCKTPLIRPLLEVHRADLLAYLDHNGFTYRTDDSNADTAFTRNRIRHELLPLLRRSFNPGIDDSLRRFGDLARDAERLINLLAHDFLVNHKLIERHWSAATDATDDLENAAAPTGTAPRMMTLPYADFMTLEPSVGGEVIRQCLVHMRIGLREIGHERLSAVRQMLLRRHGGRSIQLPGGVTVERRGPDVLIQAAVH